jgi:threonine/homoserine/homoserine lactone efflux protein
MGWFLLFLVLIAAAFGVLGLVIKATVFVVLTIVMTVIVLGYIGYLMLRRQAKRYDAELNKRLQPPSHDPRY